jgi:hypothetical protein
VAFSPFNSPLKISKTILKGHLKPFVLAVITPALWVIYAIRGNRNAAEAVENSQTPMLIVWGEKDDAVNSQNSVATIVGKENKNVTTLILPDKGHNPYNTVAAEDKLAELSTALGDKETTDDFFKNFDFTAATQEDEEVMQKTVDFIENCK